MAVTSIWSYTNSVGKLIDYIMNPEKTNQAEWSQMHRSNDGAILYEREDEEEALLVYGMNCIAASPEIAAADMETTKCVWNKTDGRQCYHSIQSFVPGEVTPEEAHQLGIAMAEELWGKQYQVVIATHVNKEHIHNHFCINSVSFVDGKKLHFKQNYYEQLREVSDNLCREVGLNVIENPGEGVKSKRKENVGRHVRSYICSDIDSCIIDALTIDDVFDELERMGYQLKLNCKFPALSPPGEVDQEGKRRFYRFKNLYKEEGYDLSDIERRLTDDSYDIQVVGKRRYSESDKSVTVRSHCLRYRVKEIRPTSRKYRRRVGINGFFMTYYKYRRILNSLQTRSNRRGKIYVSSVVRNDMRKIQSVNDAVKYAATYGLTNLETVRIRKVNLYNKVGELTQQRLHLKNTGQAELAKEITPELVKIRSEITTCQFIESSYEFARDTVRKNERLKRESRSVETIR